MNVEDVEPWVRATLKDYGQSVTSALVSSFDGKYGPTSLHTIVAKSNPKPTIEWGA